MQCLYSSQNSYDMLDTLADPIVLWEFNGQKVAQYAIWALNIIAVLGRGEEIQNQAVGTVFYLWPQSKSLC